MRSFAIFCLLFVIGVAVAVNPDKESDVLPVSRIETPTAAKPTVTSSSTSSGAKTTQCFKTCPGLKRMVPCSSPCPIVSRIRTTTPARSTFTVPTTSAGKKSEPKKNTECLRKCPGSTQYTSCFKPCPIKAAL